MVSCGGCVRHGLDGDAGPTWKPDGASVTRSKWRRAASSRPREPDAPGPISRPLAPPGAGARWHRLWTTRRPFCTAARPAPRPRPSRPEPRSPTWSVEATGCAACAALGRGAAAREPSQQQAALQCSAAAGPAARQHHPHARPLPRCPPALQDIPDEDELGSTARWGSSPQHATLQATLAAALPWKAVRARCGCECNTARPATLQATMAAGLHTSTCQLLPPLSHCLQRDGGPAAAPGCGPRRHVPWRRQLPRTGTRTGPLQRRLRRPTRCALLSVCQQTIHASTQHAPAALACVRAGHYCTAQG